VLAAPFHLDEMGNIDAFHFFSTPYPTEAESIAKRRHVDLVIACRKVPVMYLHPPIAGKDIPETSPRMIQRLMEGKTPDWLHRLRPPGLDNFVIYEVKEPHVTH
jgi:hypothetical protein